MDVAGRSIPIEIKSVATITQDSFNGLKYWQRLAGTDNKGILVYGQDPGSEMSVLGQLDRQRWHDKASKKIYYLKPDFRGCVVTHLEQAFPPFEYVPEFCPRGDVLLIELL